MPASGSSIFSDADGYERTLRETFDLLVLHPPEFRARLTWVELPSLRLLRAQEASARIACVTLPSDQVFVTFPTRSGTSLISAGVDLQFGDLMLHPCGERLHQRTTGASAWGSISLKPASLAAFGRTIAGTSLRPPDARQLLRPAAAERQRLLRLHAQACRIAETNLERMANREIVRGLEQDMILSLITCLATAEWQQERPETYQQSAHMVRMEAVLAEHPGRLLNTRDIARSIEVSEHIVRLSCSRILGMSPMRYQRLRRLKLVRTALQDIDRAQSDCATIIRNYGFANLDRYVTEHWDVLGEMPFIPRRDQTGK